MNKAFHIIAAKLALLPLNLAAVNDNFLQTQNFMETPMKAERKETNQGENSSRIVRIGTIDPERLDLQHRIMGKDSQSHLLEAGLKEGMVALYMGCGSGELAAWMAAQVGETGRIIAVDTSQEHIDIARQRAKNKRIDNITFIQSDIQEVELPNDSVDMVYCRCFLMHFQNPLTILQKAFSWLKPGGVFAAHEPINSTSSLHPEDCLLIENLNQFLLKMANHYHVDYDIGSRLHELFYQVGYQPIHLHFSQRAVSIKTMKDLLLSFYKETGTTAVKMGIISQAELEAHTKRIQGYPIKEENYYKICQQAHITGFKPFK